MNEIIMYIANLQVKVRKNEINVEKLKIILRSAKKKCNISNKKIAEILNIPVTKVEHWFRNDKCFAIPDENLWFELKDILKIETDEFDKSITEFIIKPNVYEKANRIYDENGIMPTITCECGNDLILVR